MNATSKDEKGENPVRIQFQPTAMICTKLQSLVFSLGPRIKKLQQLKIFSDGKLQAIKRYKNFYHQKLSKPDLTCDDIMEYARYELDFLAVVREKEVDPSLEEVKNYVIFTTANCLGKLFGILVSLYPHHLQCWLLYVKFCQKMNDTIKLLKVIEDLLKVHADQPCVFQLASRCAYDDLNSLEKARNYLSKGIRAHPDTVDLYRDAFLLELSLAKSNYDSLVAKINSAKKDSPEEEPKGSIEEEYSKLRGPMELVYKAAIVKVDSADLFIEFYHHIRYLPFAQAMAPLILDDLRRLFLHKEVTWDTLAQIKLELLKDPSNQEKFKKIIEEGIEIYKQAVEKLNTPTMWGIYLDRVVEILEDDSLELPNFRKNCLIMAFTAAWHKKQLNDQHILSWSQLKDDLDKQMKLLKLGTKTFPTSVPLWSTMIMKRFDQNNEKAAWDMFKEALAHFRGDRAPLSLPLWKLMINLHVLNSKKVEMLFEEGIKQHSGVGAELKPLYVEWAVLKFGVIPRKLYDRIGRLRPFSMALHKKMIQLENYQVKPDNKALKKCYDLLVEQFGNTNVQVWFDYMQFENGFPNYRANILKLKERALKTLKPELINQFNSEMFLFTLSCYSLPRKVNTVRSNVDGTSGRGTKRKANVLSGKSNSKNKRLCL